MGWSDLRHLSSTSGLASRLWYKARMSGPKGRSRAYADAGARLIVLAIAYACQTLQWLGGRFVAQLQGSGAWLMQRLWHLH